jgi:hypothetical protein
MMMDEWRDIGTAPKDGTDILVFHPESKEQFVCYWELGCWMFSADTGLIGSPTHWMPLPPPPGAA